ncbi:MAG: hypothetical protein ACPGSB_11595, partial [Opitutales bacterium]
MKKLTLPLFAISALFFAACGDKGGASDDATSSGDAPAASGSGVTLTTEIPPELIEGTPQPIKVPNLE